MTSSVDRFRRTWRHGRRQVHLILVILAVASQFEVRDCIEAAPPTALTSSSAISAAAWRPPTAQPIEVTQRTFKMAVILPYKTSYPWSKCRAGPGIEYAVETLRKRIPSIGSSLVVNYGDSHCSETLGPLAAIDMFYNKSADVFIGPACDYAVAPIARFSPHWNIPVITGGALVQAFSDKTQYRLLTRISGSHAKLGESIGMLFAQYNWSIAGFIYNTNLGKRQALGKSECFFVLEGIHSYLRPQFRRVHRDRDIWNKAFDEQDPTDHNFTSILREAATMTRIIVLCASPDSVREIMIRAHELNFDNGEYVFFNIDLFSSMAKLTRPWYRVNDTAERNEKAQKAYEALMTVTLRKPDSEEYKNFSDEVKTRAKLQYGENIYGEEEVNSFVGAFHDAVILYALALNDTLAAGENPVNGTTITRHMWNRTFTGITGTVSIDANGDRNADYSLLDMDPNTGQFRVVANYFGNRKQYEPVPGQKIYWANGQIDPPPDTPKCGFDGSGCPPEEPFPLYAIVIIVLGSLLVIVTAAALLIYRDFKIKSEAEVNWKIRWDEITFGAQEKRKLERSNSRVSLFRRNSVQSQVSIDTIAVTLGNVGNRQVFTKTGSCRGILVAIKKFSKVIQTPSRPLLLEFKKMRDLQNDHIVRFIGVCIDPGNQCIVTEYCQKGSLQDVLENETIKLDNMFKFSLMQDIVRGMAYLHNSDVKSHGNLKSSNCVVDGRFVLKITDFGLHGLRDRANHHEPGSHAYYRNKLWTAPELLHQHNPPPEGTQKGDVYSFAIICQEIIYRRGSFWLDNEDMSPQDIYERLKDGKPLLRPTLLEPTDDEDYSEDLLNMIRQCWSESPMERPEFHALKSITKKINKEGDTGGNLLDNLLSRMEQYACNLEGLVDERTSAYLEQKKRAEDLLYNMLPESVAHQLMRGETVEAVKFDSVTIYFSDICGFTSLSADSTPLQVVDLLNDLYTTFDEIIGTVDVYKVETIGDAYMVVSGLPEKNGNLHAREIARMALKLLNAVKSFEIRHRPNEKLLLRIGIHSGPVCAGVVGRKMPRYCLFGDTVNTASRMESNGEQWKIHVSPDTKAILDTFNTFQLELRGPVEMKGKGVITTYWLMGETNPEFPDLVPPNETIC